jgi:hypothetical protein
MVGSRGERTRPPHSPPQCGWPGDGMERARLYQGAPCADRAQRGRAVGRRVAASARALACPHAKKRPARLHARVQGRAGPVNRVRKFGALPLLITANAGSAIPRQSHLKSRAVPM